MFETSLSAVAFFVVGEIFPSGQFFFILVSPVLGLLLFSFFGHLHVRLLSAITFCLSGVCCGLDVPSLASLYSRLIFVVFCAAQRSPGSSHA